MKISVITKTILVLALLPDNLPKCDGSPFNFLADSAFSNFIQTALSKIWLKNQLGDNISDDQIEKIQDYVFSNNLVENHMSDLTKFNSDQEISLVSKFSTYKVEQFLDAKNRNTKNKNVKNLIENLDYSMEELEMIGLILVSKKFVETDFRQNFQLKSDQFDDTKQSSRIHEKYYAKNETCHHCFTICLNNQNKVWFNHKFKIISIVDNFAFPTYKSFHLTSIRKNCDYQRISDREMLEFLETETTDQIYENCQCSSLNFNFKDENRKVTMTTVIDHDLNRNRVKKIEKIETIEKIENDNDTVVIGNNRDDKRDNQASESRILMTFLEFVLIICVFLTVGAFLKFVYENGKII